ncbi:MAG: Manganese and iron superoxide dismutase [Candidatus Nomurabacteria bacterium GW2011_GWE1_32_28]|uniref:superoxide dismutase n=1 Tax=Candidatus Nomurabacteria bacterium GW2011_GWF1_31_48 TaxID=1618767 RepID=A0A0G0BG15_9BACT|nr:MAG: Manganese and iron superoxide dismutase [Candidatus Nomurabacteria bacterium GW2011_GWF2_30_133]KKP28432.1 MAG: Manganese and iron superoxide dismutase [Candidatus Nomurabacteria bacterium GW2011_GWE2_31_40]KKP30012.1 MAG: Manganese and iron superoxide dismutase [Candidatus Nomurabacteria bacterium GW2011_GWF1_31_48]KKP34531.1 MAG: Manganese and iron superoxide dismutase [Candidatus Nomurabacteria bacterium GW2011_GWE1_32_28]HAS81070.1 superoxide dismutase [Candidatus Nomurabacteria bac
MKKFEELKFNIPPLKDLSTKNVEEHLKLYSGYVKHTNLILEKIEEYMSDPEKNTYIISELRRRLGFEFNGVRNHEYYFQSLEGGAKPLPENSKLKEEIEKQISSFDVWLSNFKTLAMTRGIGWAVLGYDKQTKQLLNIWIDEQHIGQLNGFEWILCIDMWEHSFIYDYATSEKKKYVDAYFENLNWEVIEENFKKVK